MSNKKNYRKINWYLIEREDQNFKVSTFGPLPFVASSDKEARKLIKDHSQFYDGSYKYRCYRVGCINMDTGHISLKTSKNIVYEF